MPLCTALPATIGDQFAGIPAGVRPRVFVTAEIDGLRFFVHGDVSMVEAEAHARHFKALHPYAAVFLNDKAGLPVHGDVAAFIDHLNTNPR